MLTTVSLDETNVFFHISQHLAAPLFAMTKSRDGGNRCENGGLVQLTRLQPVEKPLAQPVVGHNGIGTHHPGEVERLRRRTERDAVGRRTGRNICKGTMPRAEQGHIGVNLIAHHQNLALRTELSQTGERCPIPTVSSRVVRVAQNQHLTSLGHRSQLVKVHFILSVLAHAQWVVHHRSAGALNRQAKQVIDRRLDEDFIAGLREGIQHKSNAFHHTRHETDPLRRNAPIVVCRHPVDNGGAVVGRFGRVAQNWMRQTIAQGIENEIGGGKIHIGHPKREQVGASPARAESVDFERTRTGTVNVRVEMIGRHGREKSLGVH